MIIIILIISIATIVITIIIIWKSHGTHHCGNEVCFHLNSEKVIYRPDTQKCMEISKIVRQSKHKTESEIPNSFLQYSRSINLKYFEHSWESQTTYSSKYQINFPTQCYLKELNQFCVPMDVCPLCP